MPSPVDDLKAAEKDAKAALLARVNQAESRLKKYIPWVNLIVGVLIGFFIAKYLLEHL